MKGIQNCSSENVMEQYSENNLSSFVAESAANPTEANSTREIQQIFGQPN